MKSIGDNLKLFRLRCNLSLTDAGSKVGLSAPGLLKYERNKVNHSLDKLNKLADIYNVTLDDILKVDDTASIKFTNLRVGTSVSEARIEKIKSLIQNKVDNYFELHCLEKNRFIALRYLRCIFIHKIRWYHE